MTLAEFTARGATWRLITSPHEYALAVESAWPFIYRQLFGHFPWER